MRDITAPIAGLVIPPPANDRPRTGTGQEWEPGRDRISRAACSILTKGPIGVCPGTRPAWRRGCLPIPYSALGDPEPEVRAASIAALAGSAATGSQRPHILPEGH